MSIRAANPPWADKAIKQYCELLEGYAAERGLPMPLLDRCVPVDELGCGHYGCVYSTVDPEVVFKITSDETEAHFIGCYLQLRDKIGKNFGIVDYKTVVRLSGLTHQRRNLYGIWRESAYYVGNWWAMGKMKIETTSSSMLSEDAAEVRESMKRNYFAEQIRTVQRLLKFFGLFARTFRSSLKGKWSSGNKAVYDEIADAWQKRLDVDFDIDYGFKIASASRGVWRLAYCLRACETIAELLESEYLGVALGGALGLFLSQGLLLADVHEGNLGVRAGQVEPIITDPGHLIMLNPEWEKVEVDALAV
jgi:hypothetical protein